MPKNIPTSVMSLQEFNGGPRETVLLFCFVGNEFITLKTHFELGCYFV